MSKHVMPLLALFAVLGCGSSSAPPTAAVSRVGLSSGAGDMGVTEIHNEPGRVVHAYDAPADSVRHAMAQVYEMLEIPGAGAAPEEQLYGARNFRPGRIEGKRPSAYIDCGMGPTATPKADEYAINMSLVSRLTQQDDGMTRVETMLEATGRPRSSAGNRVTCRSRGTLEGRVSTLIAWVLLGAEGNGGPRAGAR